uniref:Uncharacterized protein n=1 Tax=Oryza sativa subsp. japonica TaxID=39947 RepID=Q69LV8_ORYSJ|nr:hypothetical protein [Oryza sativa Japonica Group]
MEKSSIALLFQKHEAKKVASCDIPIPYMDEGSSVRAVDDALIDEDVNVVDERSCEEQEHLHLQMFFI